VIPDDLRADRQLLLREVAELFGVDSQTVRRWAKGGRLPAWRTPGGKFRIRASDAYAALEANLDEVDVVTTLHERIEAAVRERMALAEAAAADATEEWYRYERYVEAKHPHPQIFDADEEPVLWLAMDGTQAVMDHIAANDPGRIVRDCERDLKVLGRHKQVVAEGWGKDALVCELTWMASDGWPIDWPCDDIRDLAEAYGITEEAE